MHPPEYLPVEAALERGERKVRGSLRAVCRVDARHVVARDERDDVGFGQENEPPSDAHREPAERTVAPGETLLERGEPGFFG
jgi:hypothetical protein